MCGRFVRKSTLKEIAEAFDLDVSGLDFEFAPSYNIAPGQPVAAAVFDGRRTLKAFKWGLVPFWAKDEKIGYKLINARAETLSEKPGFKQAFAKRRCLVVADGFYEWRQEGNSKTPFFVQLKSAKPFAFAGLYEKWKSPAGKEIESCAIITTTPNPLMKPIHDRMPAILDRKHCDQWLDPSANDSQKLSALLKPYDPDKMEAYPVSQLVNSPKNDSPECIKPMPQP
ncbi:MAG: SOS response-associated peptidase [Candidatus Edwardsbacteria bacterium]|nr:SOS response-associated peptidase [Candidatus Edwardsbacteria bacterium]